MELILRYKLLFGFRTRSYSEYFTELENYSLCNVRYVQDFSGSLHFWCCEAEKRAYERQQPPNLIVAYFINFGGIQGIFHYLEMEDLDWTHYSLLVFDIYCDHRFWERISSIKSSTLLDWQFILSISTRFEERISLSRIQV